MAGDPTNRSGASSDRIEVLAAQLAAATAGLTLTLALYARSLDMLRTDIPLRAGNGRIFWIASIIVAVGFGVVVGQLSRWSDTRSVTLRRPAPQRGPAAVAAGILPALSLFAAVQLAAWDTRAAVVIAAPLLAGAGVFTAVVVRSYLLTAEADVYPGARLVQTVLTAGVAFLALSLTYGWMAGAAYTTLVVFVLSALLMIQAFDGIRVFPVRRAAYALAGAVIVAESALALRYWPPTGWYGGAFLATVFVVLMLSIEAILTRRMTTDVVTRYLGAGVGVCGLLIFLAR